MVITGPQKQEATFGVRAAGFVTFFCFLFFFWLVGGEATELWSHHLPPGGGSSSVEELKDIVTHISLSRNQDLPQGCTTIWLFLLCFCIPSLPWLAIVWIHPLELREGQGGRRKPVSYRQEMENTEQICTPEPHRVLLSFNLGNRANMTVITSCQNGA